MCSILAKLWVFIYHEKWLKNNEDKISKDLLAGLLGLYVINNLLEIRSHVIGVGSLPDFFVTQHGRSGWSHGNKTSFVCQPEPSSG